MLQLTTQKEEEIIEYLQSKPEHREIKQIHFGTNLSAQIKLIKIVKLLNARCTEIERADFYTPTLCEEEIATFVANRKNLSQLHIHVPVGDATLTYVSLTCNITSLTLLDNWMVTDDGLENILNPNLTYLNLQGCSKLTGSFLKFVSKDVTGLRLSNTHIDLKYLKKYIPNFQKLEDLRIAGVDDILLATIAASCKQLRVLDIPSSQNVSDLWISMILSQNKGLIRLHLAYCPAVRGQFLKAQLEHPSLCELWLTGCVKINTKYLTKFLQKKSGPKIRILHLASIPSIQDSLLSQIVLDELNLLNLQGTSVTITAATEFRNKISSLEKTTQIKFVI